MKKLLLILSFSLIFNLMFSFDFDVVDGLNHDGKYSEALKILKENHDPANPDAGIIWRISREMFEVADAMDKSMKSEKIALFSDAMNFLEPFLKITTGEARDRAFIVFYYASNLGSKSKVIGIGESLGSLPDLKKYADIAISIDPSMASAYFLKAKIEEEVPTFMGADRFKMGEYFSQAVKYNPADLTIVYDTANALYNRNWDEKKKATLSEKAGSTINDFITRNDRDISKDLIENGIKLFKTLENPSTRDKKQYENMLKLQPKFK